MFKPDFDDCFLIARRRSLASVSTMCPATKELITIVDGLPEEKAREVVDFAPFLQQQSGDREWERIHAESRIFQM